MNYPIRKIVETIVARIKLLSFKLVISLLKTIVVVFEFFDYLTSVDGETQDYKEFEYSYRNKLYKHLS